MARTDTLGNFLTDVADAIRTKKGSSDTILASDFDTEIENLPSGGNTPTTIAELNDAIEQMAVDFEDYVKAMPNSYSVYTNEPVTLYTPNIDYKYYTIHKRSSGKYRVSWQNFSILSTQANNNVIAKHGWRVYAGSSGGVAEIANAFNPNGDVGIEDLFGDFYYSSEYDTIEQCIQGMKNNTLTYTNGNYNGLEYVPDINYKVPYSNMGIIDEATKEPILSQKISSNETIIS